MYPFCIAANFLDLILPWYNYPGWLGVKSQEPSILDSKAMLHLDG